MLNDEQLQVINHIYGPAAVLSGAGSGKTSTLIGRIEHLSNFTNPKKIVMLTFTNAAADEMKLRAAKINEKCKDVYASTYHKYCGMMLRRYGRSIGIEPSFEILTGSKYKTFIEYIKSSSDLYEGLKDFPSSSKLDGIFSRLINTDATIEQIVYNTKYAQYSTEIYNLYNEVKKVGLEQQKLNFDDMLVYMNRLLDNEDICMKVANSFDFLMVDEFQDTNDLQLRMLLKLSKYNNNIVVVGDISQSIYKFRGARVQNIRRFIDSFDNCEIFTLKTNYRSTQEILDATNDMMNRNVRSWTYTDMVSNNRHGDKPVIKHNRNDYDQAEWIINRVNQAVREGYDLWQIAIIERKSMSSFKLENELAKANIPFIKRGGMKFTEYAVVDDILSFLAVVTKKADKFSWFNILKLIPGIGPKAATDISDVCTEDKFWEKFKTRKFSNDLNELINNLDTYRTMTENVPSLLDNIAEYYFALRTSKVENSKMSSSSKFDAMEKIKRDQEVYEILKGFSTSYTDVVSFLDDIALDSLNSNEDGDHLIITTIHSAKGLEWPMTILIDAVEFDINDEEEELRCLYVAMTRAEYEMIISIPDMSIMNGMPIYNEMIHFLHGSEQFFDIK